MKFFIGFISLVIIGSLILVSSYISAYNYGNSQEKLIIATVDNNQNIYAQTGRKIQAIAKVPGMMKKDTLEIVKAAIEGRYGEDGSKQVFLAVQEMNPTVDGKLYSRIQDVIESSSNEFQAGQKILIDIRRSYETALGSFWTGMWLRQIGYPHIDLANQKYKPVTTVEASDTFESGIQEEIKF